MTWWRTVGLVVAREIRARRRATLIVTGILVTVAIGAMLLISSAASNGVARAEFGSAEADQVIGFIGVIVMFMAILMTRQIILMGVAEEKNSRVAEVVLGAMRPRLLLAGKVLAIGALGLFEVLLTGALILGVGGAMDTFDLPPATGGAVGIVVLWFVLGFAFYSTVYAAAGALVARHQNAANAAGPINVLMMIGYFVGVISASGAGVDNPVLRVASLLPPFAPITMPLRMITGEAAGWEVALTIALVVVSSYGLILLAERVYAGGLLAGGKIRLRQALRDAIR